VFICVDFLRGSWTI